MMFINVCFVEEFFRAQKNSKARIKALVGKLNLFVSMFLDSNFILKDFRTIKRLLNK